LRSIGWPPGGIKARLGGAFNAEKIGAPDRRRAEVESETAKRYSDLCCPYFGFFVDVGAAFHAEVRVGALAMFDVEVNPKAVGADFEFEIVAGISGVRLEKDFDYVAIPQMIAAAGRSGVRKKCERAVTRTKMQVKGFRSPQKPDLSFELRVSVFSLPVGIEGGRLGGVPRGGRRIAIGRERLRERGDVGGVRNSPGAKDRKQK